MNPAAKAVVWTANGSYKGTPAFSGGAVYALSAGTLVVRDAASGGLLWSFTGDGTLSYPPVIAGGFVYVASDDNVYAVDVATHAAVWTAAGGGWLAIASGRLLVARANGTLSAFQLTVSPRSPVSPWPRPTRPNPIPSATRSFS